MTMRDELALLAVHTRRRHSQRPMRLPYALRAAELAEPALTERIGLTNGGARRCTRPP
jgi:hypothetical protein